MSLISAGSISLDSTFKVITYKAHSFITNVQHFIQNHRCHISELWSYYCRSIFVMYKVGKIYIHKYRCVLTFFRCTWNCFKRPKKKQFCITLYIRILINRSVHITFNRRTSAKYVSPCKQNGKNYVEYRNQLKIFKPILQITHIS